MKLDEYICPSCNMQLLNPKPTDLVQTPPTVGDILLCGACGCVAEVGILFCTELTKAQLDRMPVVLQKELMFAARAIKRKIRQS